METQASFEAIIVQMQKDMQKLELRKARNEMILALTQPLAERIQANESLPEREKMSVQFAVESLIQDQRHANEAMELLQFHMATLQSYPES